ncbi:HAMP domain-containing protein [Saccharopolyspora sp. ASAGF58]|uniref:HAMP domain-containing protein n=1 Tax=Saccharopolyspora sp. ASAGF58 TaxID=2719023 RepID=UPI00143FE5E0|nr:HAMP domain-containing protein [Saccharopolyspora sp. ASAGF58]QIZ38555.1 HAMP domain-containing protein [Saccharopolyspora sp. ASAGF58]
MSSQPPDVPSAEPDLAQPVREDTLLRLVIGLRELRDGNFRRRLVFSGGGLATEVATVFNELAERNQFLVGELERVSAAAERGEWPIPQIDFDGSAHGGWTVAANSVNTMTSTLLAPMAELNRVLGAFTRGDLTQRMPRRAADAALPGELAGLSTAVNEMLDQLSLFAQEITRVAREIGTEGKLGGQAQVPGLVGTWRDLADSVNGMAADLAGQLRDISHVAKAVAAGDLTRKITVEVSGETRELKETINTMVDQLSGFAEEVTRVAREVASEGRLGGQAEVPGAAGTWRGLVDSVNFMANNLTVQVRNIAQVATAVARGDLTQKIDVDARGEILQLKNTINTMVDQLSAFADEVTRVAREVGTDGKLGGQARVHGVAGTWKDLTDNVNIMADNLTNQVRNIAQVTTAVARGDLSKKIMVEAKGEVAALAETINGMVETLRAFAEQVTLVAREVGTEGSLGGQARVPNVAGTWKDLTDNVNIMARNLTNQVRNIAQVTTAVARGDLSKKIDVDARGEILELKTTINTMVDQLSAFAAEVTRVAREVGTEGKLGGQAEVADVSGTWRRLTESVNRLAGNLTTQVRAIALVATAVTEGDLTRQITVDASGEVAELKDNINAMISNLKETTRANQEQDWLKTNLARISALMQGQHDLDELAQLIMTELAPLVSAQYGAFFLSRPGEDDRTILERTAGYGRPGSRDGGPPLRFEVGESLVGQVAADRKSILVTDVPPEYVRISSGLGATAPADVAIVPVLFEGEVLAVIELASVNKFTSVHLDLLERLKETIGVDVNTIVVNSRTEALLAESQHLAKELQARSEQLQQQQTELQRSNTELEEKAALLASRNRDIELKNIEIEQARQELEERARQLSQASAYKSEFLANMSHELRTPLNSVLILAKLLADNMEGNLTLQQVDLAKTVHQAGTDLLQLINDVLDLSKVEAGQMHLLPEDVELVDLAAHMESLYQPLAADKGLAFEVSVAPSVPPTVRTDRNRLEQIVRNLLSNAVKFTDKGAVELRVRPAQPSEVHDQGLRHARRRVAFSVRDTGIGIPADKLSLIFEAFQQVDGTTVRKYGGTGLGLSISRELTALLGGELQVDSEPGRGSTFTLYLPMEPSMTKPVEPVAEPEPVPWPVAVPERPPRGYVPSTAESSLDVSAEGIDPPMRSTELIQQEGHQHMLHVEEPAERASLQFNGEKVLVVDDDYRSVQAMRLLLEQHGLQVVHADNALAGLNALQHQGDIMIVLMDVMMPEMDGNATIRIIREMPRYRDLTIIAITAKAMKGDREASIAAGATECMSKPVDVNKLLELLAEHLPAGRAPETEG